MKRSVWTALVTAGALTVAGQAGAAEIFLLHSTFDGDGGVTPLPGGGFDLFGANNGTSKIFTSIPLQSLTTYTATAGANENLTFDWTYTTHDGAGSHFDPGGYLVNGAQFQLSPASSVPEYVGSGQVVLNLTAGDTYGFYIFSTDSQTGRADIRVTPLAGLAGPLAAAVPEPATWATMIVGFFGLGAALRRRRAMVAVAG
jgi:hypothetical protein